MKLEARSICRDARAGDEISSGFGDDVRSADRLLLFPTTWWRYSPLLSASEMSSGWFRVAANRTHIVAAGLQSGQPLFQSVNSVGTEATGRALNRYNAWAAIRKRAKAAGFLTPVGCHTWRATGITIYLENDGRLEHAQQMAGHESPRTTKLYDRTKDEITLSEVERIRL
jgi:integrase